MQKSKATLNQATPESEKETAAAVASSAASVSSAKEHAAAAATSGTKPAISISGINFQYDQRFEQAVAPGRTNSLPLAETNLIVNFADLLQAQQEQQIQKWHELLCQIENQTKEREHARLSATLDFSQPVSTLFVDRGTQPIAAQVAAVVEAADADQQDDDATAATP